MMVLILVLTVLLSVLGLASSSLRIYANGAIVPEEEPAVAAVRKLQEAALRAAKSAEEDELADGVESGEDSGRLILPPVPLSRLVMPKPVIPPAPPVAAKQDKDDKDEDLLDEKALDELVRSLYGRRRYLSGTRPYRGYRRYPAGLRDYPGRSHRFSGRRPIIRPRPIVLYLDDPLLDDY